MNKWKIILPAAAFLLLAGQAVAQSEEDEERLRELELALQEAQTDEERDEIRRRLQRLGLCLLAIARGATQFTNGRQQRG